MLGFASPVHILLLILVIALVFGAKRVPELARGVGKGIREVKQATGIDELRESVGDVKDTLRSTAAIAKGDNPAPAAPAAPAAPPPVAPLGAAPDAGGRPAI